MKYGKFLMLFLILAGFAGFSWSSKGAQAKADIKDAKGNVLGVAYLKQKGENVKIAVAVKGLTPGEHGIHVHTEGKCEGPDFASAGGHFNPTGKQHGLKNPQGAHGGDLPNLKVSKKGKAHQTLTAHGVTLREGEANSLLKAGGTSLMIHAGPDDDKTDPSGNSGGRIACGVIEKIG